MKHEMFYLVDTAFGGVDKRNRLMDVRKLRLPKEPVDCYRTVYRYPEAMKEHFSRQKTVAGYQGSVYADWVPVDIDSEDLQKAHHQARLAVEEMQVLYDIATAQMRVFFSGAKGFHLLLPAEWFGLEPDERMPEALKQMVVGLFDGVDFDPVIYDRVRLFRLTNTVNSKSGLYKIELSPHELMNSPLAEILEWAKQPRPMLPVEEPSINEGLAARYREALTAKQNHKLNGSSSVIDRYQKLCIVTLLKGVPRGERNEAALRLATHFLRTGLSAQMVFGLLKEWNQLNQPPDEEKSLRNAINSAAEHGYDFGCHDPLLGKYCDSACYYQKTAAKDRDAAAEIRSITDAQQAYLEYVGILKQARIRLGLGPVDDKMRGIAPGELCQIVARSSVGKTTLLLNILKNVVGAGAGPVLFFTLEMPLAQVFERMCQISNEALGAEIEIAASDFAGGAESYQAAQWTQLAERTTTAYAGCWFVDRDGLSLEDLECYVRLFTEKTGRLPRLVAVDYMGRLDGGLGSAYERTSRLAIGLKALAKNCRVAVLSLHQIARTGGEGDEPVTLNAGRDSGVTEEAADQLIGMWRPERRAKRTETSEPVIVALLKNRRGGEGQVELTFHKPTLRMVVAREMARGGITGTEVSEVAP